MILFARRFALVLLAALISGALPAAAQSNWIHIQPPASPSPRAEYGFAFDETREAAVLFGGSANLSFAAVNAETWEWDGTTWTLAPAGGPSARCDQTMAYDTVRDRIAIFGGFNGAFLGDTWHRSDTIWSLQAIPGPGSRADAFMAFDQNRGVMVLFGGLAPGNIVRGDTWEYDGTWVQRPVGGPPARWIQRMAYDAARGVTVMFGGVAPSGPFGDTWEWDGDVWSQVMIPGPPARYAHAMAYDADRQRVLLFGGQNGDDLGEGVLGDTWEYDGKAWTQVQTAVSPSARTFVKMVYDLGRRRMVLFGGYNGAQMVNDTWELVSESAGIESEPVVAVRPTLAVAPNPASGAASIRYTLPADSALELAIYGTRGELVRRLVARNDVRLRGAHTIAWDGADETGRQVANGIYHCRLLLPGAGVTTARFVFLH